MLSNNRKSAGKERIALPPTTIPREGSTHKRVEVFAPKPRNRHGEDIVCAVMKITEVHKRTAYSVATICERHL